MTPTLQDRALKALKAVDDSSFVSNIDPQAVHIKGIDLDHAHTIRECLRLAADPWMPIESAPKDVVIDTHGIFKPYKSDIQIPMRFCNDYISSNTVYPLIATNQSLDDVSGTYTRTHWMPLPAAPVATAEDVE